MNLLPAWLDRVLYSAFPPPTPPAPSSSLWREPETFRADARRQSRPRRIRDPRQFSFLAFTLSPAQPASLFRLALVCNTLRHPLCLLSLLAPRTRLVTDLHLRVQSLGALHSILTGLASLYKESGCFRWGVGVSSSFTPVC